MSHNRIFLSAILILLLTGTGCSKSRWLSRNDYSEMHDPFMEEESAVAETPAVPKAGSGVGRARLSDSDTASISTVQVPTHRTAAASAPLSGPKPIQQASGTAAARSPVSQASYPQDAANQPTGIPRNNLAAKKGPSLSDFMSQPGSSPAANNSAASSPATASTMNADDAGFMNWAQQQEPPVARPVPSAAPVAAAPVAATPAAVATPTFDEIETAEPLIPATSAAPRGANPFAELESPTFDAPVEEDEIPSAPAPFGETIRPVKPAENAPLDSDFMQDTGWKPSSLTRP